MPFTKGDPNINRQGRPVGSTKPRWNNIQESNTKSDVCKALFIQRLEFRELAFWKRRLIFVGHVALRKVY
jgi:hypothetical protein